MLLEMYDAGESVFNQTLYAYRLGDFKLIVGTVRDENYYFESTTDRINSSHPSVGSNLVEAVVELQDYLFGKGQSDTLNIVLVHVYLNDIMAVTDYFFPRTAQLPYAKLPAPEAAPADGSLQKRLYNIARDPCERVNLAADPQYAAVIADIEGRIAVITRNRPHILPMDQQLDISLGGAWHQTHVSGDCSASPNIPADQCRFTHSWVADVSVKNSCKCSLCCFCLLC